MYIYGFCEHFLRKISLKQQKSIVNEQKIACLIVNTCSTISNFRIN